MASNPFFVDINGGSVKKLGKDLYLHYKTVYILCTHEAKLTIDDLEVLYDKKSDIQQLINIVPKMRLIRANVNILKNKIFKLHANVVDGAIINDIFGHTTIEQNEIIVIAPEMNEQNFMTYNFASEPRHNIKHMREILGLVTLYQARHLDHNILSLINDIDNVKYWTNKRNVCFNVNSIFNDRKLVASSKGSIDTNEPIIDAPVNRVQLKTTESKKTSEYTDVFQTQPKFYHSNIYEAIKKSPNRSFYATQPDVNLTKDYIADIFDLINNKKYRFFLFNTLLTSKDFCHLVVNNARVLARNSDILDQFKMLYSILWGYAWVTLYVEESIFTTKATKQNRFAFDIETANLLPTFPFTYSHVKMNPYMVLQLSDELMAINANCIGIDAMEHFDRYYGICTKAEAFERMNIFTTGDSTKYLFDGLSDIFAVSGSIMTACLPRLNPLFDACTHVYMDSNTVQSTALKHWNLVPTAWNTFFNTYYGNSDIDLMCATDTLCEFLTNVTNMLSVVANNLQITVDNFEITPNKATAVVISPSFCEHCLDDINKQFDTHYTQNELSNILNQMANDSTLFLGLKLYFYDMYLTEKKIMTDKWTSQIIKHKHNIDKRLLNAFHEVCIFDDFRIKLSEIDVLKMTLKEKDNESYYFVNDFKQKHVAENKNLLVFKFSETIKFKIHAERMVRSIEVFKVDVADPFKVVARFHKPCVRAYRQGDQIWMLPSFITASMMYLNIDYRYFACSKNPIDIINKYRSRGFGVIINADERNAMLLHQKKNENSLVVPYLTGPQKLSSPLYNAQNDDISYITNIQQLKRLYLEKYGFDANNAPVNLFNYSTIQSDGNIRLLKPWIATAIYEYIENE